MGKKFKKIYLEIINYCNLNCPFCVKTIKSPRMMSISEYEIIIKQILKFTDYIYLHIQGEPLMHPKLKTFLDIAYKNNLKVNLTTNSSLIKDNIIILLHPAVRQINISLQAVINSPIKKDIYDNILSFIKKAMTKKNYPYISLRLWGDYTDDDLINELVFLKSTFTNTTGNEKNNKLAERIFISKDDRFNWPNIDDKINPIVSKCLAPTNHIGILVDGTVVPCCLDKDGIIDLGNIFNHDLDYILSSERYQDFITKFKNNKISEELCKRCTYRNKFKNNFSSSS